MERKWGEEAGSSKVPNPSIQQTIDSGDALRMDTAVEFLGSRTNAREPRAAKLKASDIEQAVARGIRQKQRPGGSDGFTDADLDPVNLPEQDM